MNLAITGGPVASACWQCDSPSQPSPKGIREQTGCGCSSGACLCTSRGCRVLGDSVLSRVCCVYAGLPQKHCLGLLWLRLFSRGLAPSEEGSAILGFSALRSRFIHAGGTWRAAEAEQWLSLVASPGPHARGCLSSSRVPAGPGPHPLERAALRSRSL